MNKQLNKLHNLITHNITDVLKTAIFAVDMIDIGNELLETNDIDDITKFLEIGNYIENSSSIESPIPDELYDKLHAKYRALTGHSLIGTSYPGGKKTIKHSYPELRGTLSKIHFIQCKDIPINDSRKSFEDFVNSVNRVNTNSEIIHISADYKFDGLSGVFEYDNGWKHVIMRGDVENNDGTDISDLFKDNIDIPSLFKYRLPEHIYEQPFGLKTEILMMTSDYDRYIELRVGKPANRRSAVSSILNSDDEFDSSWLKYLTVVPLQISTKTKLMLTDNDTGTGWRYVGTINDRHQYIRLGMVYDFDISSPSELEISVCQTIEAINSNIREDADKIGLPIDGVVYTVTNHNLIEQLGRANNINKFQIAYKFPAGVKKTILTNIEFPIGPMGTITPLAIVKPITINGSVITHSTLSNFNKLNSLHLHTGDEVKIRYDIIPILEKDGDCKEAVGDVIIPPIKCPSCGELLDMSSDIARCINHNCPSRIVGKIINYITKLNIVGIGDAIVQDLFDMGIVRKISDLYKIKQHEDFLLKQNGYSHKKINNIVSSIYAHTELYPHEILGAIGIPDIGRRVMERVCTNIDINDLITGDRDELIYKLINIKGIGEKMAIKIVDGIATNSILIHDLLTFITIKPYSNNTNSEPKEIVCFSNIRDKDFEKFLTDNNIQVKDNYTKAVTTLIVPYSNSTSSKITKAKSDGKIIMSIDDAYKHYGYSKDNNTNDNSVNYRHKRIFK